MQKQIQDFDKITGLVPNDLFLISHVGKTASTSLATVIGYANAQLLPNINRLNSIVNALSDLNPTEAARVFANVSTLSSNLLSTNSRLSGLSAYTDLLDSSILNLSSSVLPIITDVLYLSSRELSITSDVLSLSSNFLYLDSTALALSSNLDSLSGEVVSLDTEVEFLRTDILSLSSGVLYLDSVFLSLSSNLDSLSGNFIELDSDVQTLSSSVLYSDSAVLTLSSNLDSLSGSFLELESDVNLVSTDVTSLSSQFNTLSSTFESVIIDVLNSAYDEIVALSPNILSDFYGWRPTFTSTVDTLSASIDALSATDDVLISSSAYLSGMYLHLSAYTDSLSTYTDFLSASIYSLSAIDDILISSNAYLSGMYLHLSAYTDSLSAVTNLLAASCTFLDSAFNSSFSLISCISTSHIFFYDHAIGSDGTMTISPTSRLIISTFKDNSGIFEINNWEFDEEGSLTIPGKIQSNDTITISPSGEMIISTSSEDGAKVYNWEFDKEGCFSVPGSLKFLTNPEDGGPYLQPEVLDISLSVQKLNSGCYTLPDGKEGQIMHFVPKSNAIGNTSTQVYIPNARYWVIMPSGWGGQKIAVNSPFYWMPWVLNNHRLDPVYDIFPSIAVAIFTDGAWNISTGGRN